MNYALLGVIFVLILLCSFIGFRKSAPLDLSVEVERLNAEVTDLKESVEALNLALTRNILEEDQDKDLSDRVLRAYEKLSFLNKMPPKEALKQARRLFGLPE